MLGQLANSQSGRRSLSVRPRRALSNSGQSSPSSVSFKACCSLLKRRLKQPRTSKINLTILEPLISTPSSMFCCLPAWNLLLDSVTRELITTETERTGDWIKARKLHCAIRISEGFSMDFDQKWMVEVYEITRDICTLFLRLISYANLIWLRNSLRFMGQLLFESHRIPGIPCYICLSRGNGREELDPILKIP